MSVFFFFCGCFQIEQNKVISGVCLLMLLSLHLHYILVLGQRTHMEHGTHHGKKLTSKMRAQLARNSKFFYSFVVKSLSNLLRWWERQLSATLKFQMKRFKDKRTVSFQKFLIFSFVLFTPTQTITPYSFFSHFVIWISTKMFDKLILCFVCTCVSFFCAFC